MGAGHSTERGKDLRSWSSLWTLAFMWSDPSSPVREPVPFPARSLGRPGPWPAAAILIKPCGCHFLCPEPHLTGTDPLSLASSYFLGLFPVLSEI